MHKLDKKYILTVRCPDTIGISASVFNFIYENGGFITSSANYGDPSTNMFFMRIVFTEANEKFTSIENIKIKFQQLAAKFSMQWDINDYNYRPRTVIAVSKY